jgi:dTDP-glucose pyrophosphorylase
MGMIAEPPMPNRHLIQKITLPPTAPMREAARVIQMQEIKLVLVCDADGKLLGTVTDGDIRRSILADLGSDAPVDHIMNTRPRVTRQHENRQEIRDQMRSAVIRHLPEVDDAGRVIDIFCLDEPDTRAPLDNPVVLMAGGRGERLRPLTEHLPKPLLKVGGKPVMERTIESLARQGFREFHLSVNFLGHMIEDYFGDGSRLGVRIHYLRERQPLGTAGALCGLPRPSRPFVVMNGDLLTGTNVRAMVEMCEAGAKAVMGAREYAYTVPYGCLTVDSGRIKAIEEKPTLYHFISAGIYAFAPEALDFVPHDTPQDMPDLFRRLIEAGNEVRYHHITEEWIDIGSKEDLAWARRLHATGQPDD